MRRKKIHVAQLAWPCEEVTRDALDPRIPRDDCKARPADPECHKLHDWAPCRCGYRPKGAVPFTWHYADECPYLAR